MHVKAEICIYVTFHKFILFQILLIKYISNCTELYLFLIWESSVLDRINTICGLRSCSH